MKNKKNIYWVVSIAISIVAIFFGVYYSSRIKEFANKSDAAADVSLYLEPTTSNLVTNSVLIPMLRINPTTNQVTAIEANLTFDASKLSVESITPASNYIILKSAVVDNTAGTASIVLGIKGGVGITPVPVTTTSDVASIRIRSKAVVGDAIMRVASTSRVAAKNIDTNVAGTYGQMTVHITAAATPTPTVAPYSIKVITPNGGESYKDGVPFAVTWTSTKNFQNFGVKLQHYDINNIPDKIWIDMSASDTGTLNWTSFSGVIYDNRYKIRITGVGGGVQFEDMSDNYFAITAPNSTSPTPTATATVRPTATATTRPTVTPTATATTYADWDVVADSIINVLDIGVVSDNYGSSSPTNPRADVNKDGMINVIDIGIIVDHYQ